MKLLILQDNGCMSTDQNVVSTVENVTVVPAVGCIVTTEDDIYTIIEIGIDYTAGEIHAWADKD